MAQNIAGSLYNKSSPSLTSQEASPTSLFFKSDGTKLYVLGSGGTVYQYSLSSAWDVSTASYDSVSKSVIYQESTPIYIFFKSDGTKLYVLDQGNDFFYDRIYEYSLSSAWDVSTASYIDYFTPSQAYLFSGIFFKSDGTKLYLLSRSSGTVYQYSLSSAWDVSTASYDSVSLNISSSYNWNIWGLWFESDGYTFYMSDSSTKIIKQYSLSSAWDVSTGSHTDNLCVSEKITINRGIFFTSNTTSLYIIDMTSDKVYNYDVPGEGVVLIPKTIMPVAARVPIVGVDYPISVPKITVPIIAKVPDIFAGWEVLTPKSSISVIARVPEINVIIIPPKTSLPIIARVPEINIIVVPPKITMPIVASIPSISFFSMSGLVIRYLLTVTGSADSSTDIELPMSSFQARRKSGEATYLSVVIPTLDLSVEITERSNGTIKVEQAYEFEGELLQRELILEAEIDNIKMYQGGRNQSVVLDGYKTTSYTPKSITLSTATYRALSGGKIRYRVAEPNIFLNPGDTVTIGLDTFIIGVISYSVTVKNSQIELEEA